MTDEKALNWQRVERQVATLTCKRICGENLSENGKSGQEGFCRSSPLGWWLGELLPQPSTSTRGVLYLTPSRPSFLLLLLFCYSFLSESFDPRGTRKSYFLLRVLDFQPPSTRLTRQLTNPHPTLNTFENLGHFAMVLLADS